MLSAMAASSRLMITEAERRFAVRVRVAIPPAGLGERLNRMHAWLDDNCGADGWEITPAGLRGVINDAIAVRNYVANSGSPPGSAARRRWLAPPSFDPFCDYNCGGDDGRDAGGSFEHGLLLRRTMLTRLDPTHSAYLSTNTKQPLPQRPLAKLLCRNALWSERCWRTVLRH